MNPNTFLLHKFRKDGSGPSPFTFSLGANPTGTFTLDNTWSSAGWQQF